MALISKTFAGAGNRKTWTWSAWIKIIADTSKLYTLMTQVDGWSGNSNAGIYLNGESLQSYNLLANLNDGTSSRVSTTAMLRDPSAWYHIVFRFDTTQSTSSDRARWYINGQLQTDLVHAYYPGQNYDANFNTAAAHGIGRHTDNTNYPFEGVMSHVIFCDGQSYAPTEFGETDSTTGEWKFKIPSGLSYGTNGFYILKDNAGVTDQSGQGNNWSVTAGTVTATQDCPSNNFATINSLYKSQATYTHGNLVSSNASEKFGGVSTIGVSSGKWYAEFKYGSASGDNGGVGIYGDPQAAARANQGVGKQANSYSYRSDANKVIENTATSYGNTYGSGDIIGVALDLDNNKLYFSKNGTWQNSGVPTSGSTGTGAIPISLTPDTGFWFMAANCNSASNTAVWSHNYGNGYFGSTAVSSAGTNASNNGIFEYDVPAGYQALCTKGLNA